MSGTAKNTMPIITTTITQRCLPVGEEETHVKHAFCSSSSSGIVVCVVPHMGERLLLYCVEVASLQLGFRVDENDVGRFTSNIADCEEFSVPESFTFDIAAMLSDNQPLPAKAVYAPFARSVDGGETLSLTSEPVEVSVDLSPNDSTSKQVPSKSINDFDLPRIESYRRCSFGRCKSSTVALRGTMVLWPHFR
jgi:hypothetical protein